MTSVLNQEQKKPIPQDWFHLYLLGLFCCELISKCNERTAFSNMVFTKFSRPTDHLYYSWNFFQTAIVQEGNSLERKYILHQNFKKYFTKTESFSLCCKYNLKPVSILNAALHQWYQCNNAKSKHSIVWVIHYADDTYVQMEKTLNNKQLTLLILALNYNCEQLSWFIVKKGFVKTKEN